MIESEVRLRVPHIRVLQLLYGIGTIGGLTRSEISRRLGTSGTLVGKTIGYSDPEKRAAFKLTKDGISAGTPLLELGYIVEEEVSIDGSTEILLSLTEQGKRAYEALPSEAKRLPPPLDGWAKKKGRIPNTEEEMDEDESDYREEGTSDSYSDECEADPVE